MKMSEQDSWTEEEVWAQIERTHALARQFDAQAMAHFAQLQSLEGGLSQHTLTDEIEQIAQWQAIEASQ